MAQTSSYATPAPDQSLKSCTADKSYT